MNKEELTGLGLTEEQADKVIAGYKDFIPKSRFDEVNNAKKKAEESVAERDKQLEQLKKNGEANAALQAEIEKLQTENKTAAEKYAADLKAVQINSAVEKALAEAGAKNTKAVRALLEGLDDAELDGDSVKGLADQIKKLQTDESSKFLFETGGNIISGLKPSESGAVPPEGGKTPSQMSYAELRDYLAQNPNAKI